MSAENPITDDVNARQQAVFDRLMMGQSEKARSIIRRRFGLNGDVPVSMNILAGERGVSRSYISQLIGNFQNEILWDLDFYKLEFPLSNESLELLDTTRMRLIKAPDRVRLYMDACQAQFTIQSPEVQSILDTTNIIVPETSKNFPWQASKDRNPYNKDQIYLI